MVATWELHISKRNFGLKFMPLEGRVLQVPMGPPIESHCGPQLGGKLSGRETLFPLTKGEDPAKGLGIVPNSIQPLFTPGGLPEANKLTAMRKCPPSQGVR